MLAIVLIVLGAVACVVPFLLRNVAPGGSRQAQRVINEGLESLMGEAVRTPSWLGKWRARQFGESEQATDKNARAARKTRDKLPF